MRVRYLKKETSADPTPRKGQEGTYIRPGDASFIRIAGESREDRAYRLAKFAETHSMILWDGCRHAWNCPNDDFEILED